MPLKTDTYKDIFINSFGLIDEPKFKKIIEVSSRNQRSFEQAIMEQILLTKTRLLQLYSDYFKVQYVELKIGNVDKQALEEITEKYATDNEIIPFSVNDEVIKVAMVDPTNEDVIKQIKTMTGKTVEIFVTTSDDLQKSLALYSTDADIDIEKVIASMDIKDSQNTEKNTARLFDIIISAAVLKEVSDVHLEPFENELLLRFRSDGILSTVAYLPSVIHDPLVSLIKIKSNMRLDEKRVPQDGRFSFVMKGQETNVRVSTVPSLFGEKAALRILPKDAHLLDTTNLGFLENDLKIIKENLAQPYGLILACGPTGSGKTTSLYSFLQEIGLDKINAVNISTIEDPIEYTIPRVVQIETKPEIDLTFATGLKALLRQDPDIIMVGEIRDGETAEFSIRAALVGRLVLSSLHTNDAVGAIPRLLDMGIEPYLLSSTLKLIVAQRLARKLCEHCRYSDEPGKIVLSKETLSHLKKSYDIDRLIRTLKSQNIIGKEISKFEEIRLYSAKGCNKCDNTGYKGRIGLFEVLSLSDELRVAIKSREDSEVLRKIALEQGMKTMFEDGMAKVVMGLTDINELMRATYK